MAKKLKRVELGEMVNTDIQDGIFSIQSLTNTLSKYDPALLAEQLAKLGEEVSALRRKVKSQYDTSKANR